MRSQSKPGILIYDSCMTMDIFRLDGENLKSIDYFARSSFVSMVSKPVPVLEKDIILESNLLKAERRWC